MQRSPLHTFGLCVIWLWAKSFTPSIWEPEWAAFEPSLLGCRAEISLWASPGGSSGQRDLLLTTDLWMSPTQASSKLPLGCTPVTFPLSGEVWGSLPKTRRFFLTDLLWKWPSKTSWTSPLAPVHLLTWIIQGKNGCVKAQSTQTSCETWF